MDPLSLGTAEFFVRSLVAGIFVWAGASKFGDAGFEDAAERLTRLPTRIVRPAAQALPPFELAVGVGLLLPWTAQLAAIVGIAVLLAFAALLGRRRLQRAPESCACFGSTDDRPVSWLQVARNVGMGAALVPAVLQVPTQSSLPPENAALAAGTAGLALLSLIVHDHLKTAVGLAKGVSSQ